MPATSFQQQLHGESSHAMCVITACLPGGGCPTLGPKVPSHDPVASCGQQLCWRHISTHHSTAAGRRPGAAAAAAAAPGPSAQQQSDAAAFVDLSQLDRLAGLMAAEEHPGPLEDEEEQEQEEGGTQAAAAGAAAGGGSRSVRRRLLQEEDGQQQMQRQTQQQQQQTARSASTPLQQLQSQQRSGQGTQPSQRAPVVDLSQSPDRAAGSSAARGAGSSRGA
jgi:hypothetical protein